MKINNLLYIGLFMVCFQFSCKKYLEVDPPKGSLVQSTVFDNNDQAISAVTGIYATMATTSSGYASGGANSVTDLSGTSSDELTAYSALNIPFYQNQITYSNSKLTFLYAGPYTTIYTANSILEGLASSTGVSPPIKAQLQGEALFIRAFAYFYLVNLFGPVPLQLSTDYQTTSVASRVPEEQIYQQIITDLKTAEGLLPEAYPSTGRVRPNKSAAQALLARVYLYQKNYVDAENYASLVIAKTSTYSLVDVNSVFLSTSQEAIWQLMPSTNTNTMEGAIFILQATPIEVSLSSSLAVNAFEPGDKRQSTWVQTYSNNTGTYYYPYKYKVKSSANVTEYSMVMRLAEQYLIRAEARINQPGKIDQGIADLNVIRARARQAPTTGIPNPLLPLSSGLNQSAALLAVEQERRVELFAEWGHRWLDLKRTGRASAVLGPLKSQWQPTDGLYPIPLNEITRNPNITQNQGY
jgi:hypothetical protein